MKRAIVGSSALFALVAFGSPLLNAQTYRLQFARASFRAIDDQTTQPVTETSFAPAGSFFRIVKSQDVGNVAGVIVEFSKVPEATFASILTDIYRVSGIEKPSGVVTPASTNGPPIVTTKKAYWITKEYLPPEFYELWSGVDGGTLAVPYKLQFKDGRLTGGGTLGGYLGYRQKWLRVPSTFMGSIGLAAVPTAGPTLTTGQGTVDTKIAVSAAAGAVFEIYSQIQAGIVVGTDYTGTADYAYDKRLWISLAIGAGFLKR